MDYEFYIQINKKANVILINYFSLYIKKSSCNYTYPKVTVLTGSKDPKGYLKEIQHRELEISKVEQFAITL